MSDRDTSAVPLYVTPGGSRGPLARVTRRLTVLRTTQAPQICFGVEDHHPLAGPGMWRAACWLAGCLPACVPTSWPALLPAYPPFALASLFVHS